MALEFSTVERAAVSARTDATGTYSFDCAAGKNLKIETSPAGEEILNTDVPAGKQRTYTVTVTYVEVDA